MKKQKFRLPIKAAIIYAVILLALLLIIGYIWNVFKGSDYFKIKNIILKGDDSERLTYLKRENIFSINLKRESGRILEYFPEAKKIRLVRLLPDTIFVDLVKRKAVAVVKSYKYFAVDEEGVFFYAQSQQDEQELTLIEGLEKKMPVLKAGVCYNTRELRTALRTLKEIKSSGILKNCVIKKIDVASSGNVTIFIPLVSKGVKQQMPQAENLLEVRLSEDSLKAKIPILEDLILRGRMGLANIKYIDLRFKQPLVKFNEEKSVK